MGWHSALADARAAAALLEYYIAASVLPAHWADHYQEVISWPWPILGFAPVSPVVRRAEGEKEPHFLARLVDRLPRTEPPNSDSYLAMLDQVLLDRHVSATEADALVELVATDPDSLSGKAKKARQYRIPVVTEAAFGRLLESTI